MAYQMIRAAHSSGRQSNVSRIVIHCTVSPCAPGWAVKIANYFKSPNSGGSAHYVVDPSAIVQCLPEDTIAWHAPPNTNSIGVELCDWQKGNASRWSDSDHESMLKRAAVLVRGIANRHDIPIVRIGPAELRKGKRGICGHVDVSNAWHQSDHGDPNMGGNFPWEHFLNLVSGSEEEDDMNAKDVWDHEIKVPVEWTKPGNPEWQADSLLVEVNKKARELEEKIDNLTNLIKSLIMKGQ